MAEPRVLTLENLRLRQGDGRINTVAGGVATDDQLLAAIVQAENEAEEVVGELFDDETMLDLIASATLYHLRATLTTDFPDWIVTEKTRVDRLYVARRTRVVNQPSGSAGAAVRSAALRPIRDGRTKRWLPGTSTHRP